MSCGHWEGHGDRQRLSNRFHVCCLLYNVFGSTTGLCTCFDTLLKAVDLKVIQNKWAVYVATKHSVSSSQSFSSVSTTVRFRSSLFAPPSCRLLFISCISAIDLPGIANLILFLSLEN